MTTTPIHFYEAQVAIEAKNLAISQERYGR